MITECEIKEWMNVGVKRAKTKVMSKLPDGKKIDKTKYQVIKGVSRNKRPHQE